MYKNIGVGWIFSGDHLKDIARHVGGPREAARMLTKFKILKRIKLLENKFIFQIFQHFPSPQNFENFAGKFFLENFEKLSIFYKIF